MPFFSGSGNDNDEYDNLGIDWVIHYVFDDVGLHLLPLFPALPPRLKLTSDLSCPEFTQAISEFQTLINDLHEANLRTQVRHGYGNSLLVCVRVPRDHLGNMIHKSRYAPLPSAIITVPDMQQDKRLSLLRHA